MSREPYTNQSYSKRFEDFTHDLQRWEALTKFQGEDGRMQLLDLIRGRAEDMAPMLAKESPVEALVDDALESTPENPPAPQDNPPPAPQEEPPAPPVGVG